MTTPIFGCIDPPHNYRLDLTHYILEQNLQQQRMSGGYGKYKTADAESPGIFISKYNSPLKSTGPGVMP